MSMFSKLEMEARFNHIFALKCMHHLQTVKIELKYKRKKNPQTVTELIECRNQTKSIFGRFKRLACKS